MYPDNSAIHKGDSRWFVLLLSPKRLNVFVPPIVDRGTPSVYLTYIVHKDREDKVLEFVYSNYIYNTPSPRFSYSCKS